VSTSILSYFFTNSCIFYRKSNYYNISNVYQFAFGITGDEISWWFVEALYVVRAEVMNW